MDQHTCIARPIAPEDIRKGMYVAVLSITHELLPLFCESAWVFERGEPYRMAFLPDEEESQPLKVVSLCLPFVFVKDAKRQCRTLDLRRHRGALHHRRRPNQTQTTPPVDRALTRHESPNPGEFSSLPFPPLDIL